MRRYLMMVVAMVLVLGLASAIFADGKKTRKRDRKRNQTGTCTKSQDRTRDCDGTKTQDRTRSRDCQDTATQLRLRDEDGEQDGDQDRARDRDGAEQQDRDRVCDKDCQNDGGGCDGEGGNDGECPNPDAPDHDGDGIPNGQDDDYVPAGDANGPNYQGGE